MKLPDFLIVGAAKSGTTSVYCYLRQHPNIYLPPDAQKEPHFFLFHENQPEFSLASLARIWAPLRGMSLAEYANLFEDGKEKIAGEASTLYLYLHEAVIGNIKKLLPGWQDLKILIMLRDPVQRAYSHYSMLWERGLEDRSFDEAIGQLLTSAGGKRIGDYVRQGMYFEQVKAYLENFHNVKVCLFEDLKSDPAALVRDILIFLGANPAFDSDLSEKHNQSGFPKSRLLNRLLFRPDALSSWFPPIRAIPVELRIKWARKLIDINKSKRGKLRMKPSMREALREVYAEDIANLQKLIQRDLSHWNS